MPYLYAVEMQIPLYPFNPIKIGYSVYPETRFLQFAHGPFPTVFLGKWKVKSQFAESMVHSAFERYRLVGEWFYPAEELKQFIGKRIKGQPAALNNPDKLASYERRFAALGSFEPITLTWLQEGLISREEIV